MIRPQKRTKLPIIDKIIRRQAKIGVVGLGYVGLPLAVAFGEHGFKVTGIDLDPRRIGALKQGESYIPDIESARVAALVHAKALKPSGSFEELKDLDAISICVPTPLRKTRDPDISYIVAVTSEIKKRLRRGQIVVLESTTYPGTTEEILLPELESTGLKVGQDFYLAFSPERIDPGNQKYTLRNTPKVMGGMTPLCTKVTTLLYRTIIDQVIPVSSARAAEMVKILENTFRAINIGMVNELAMICDKLGIPTWEVIEAAATKPFGYLPFYPGPGLGGHCIPVDPHYLSWKLKTLNYTTRFIELASEVNQEMPNYVFRKIQSALNERKKPVKGSKILLVGVAYKKNVSDTRESPAYDVAKLLKDAGAVLSYTDPFVPVWNPDWAVYRSKKFTPSVIKSCDCAVILTDHDAFKMKALVEHAPLIVDTRNATKGLPQKKVTLL